jgi:hypothetical protein
MNVEPDLTNEPTPLIVIDVVPVYGDIYCGAGMLVKLEDGPVAPFGSY